MIGYFSIDATTLATHFVMEIFIMLQEIVLSAALTLGNTATSNAELPFTMYFAGYSQFEHEKIADDMEYDAKQQLTKINDDVLVASSDSSSKKSKKSSTTALVLDSDTDD